MKNKLDRFFERYEKEIKFFQGNAPGICDDVVNDDFCDFEIFVCDLVTLYENHTGIMTPDLDKCVGFIFNMLHKGTDDNLMGYNLRLAYFHCVAALVEYLDFIRECEEV